MIRSGLWNVVGRGSSAAGMLAVAAIASRALPPSEFAVWAVLSTLAALLAFGDLGVANAATSELSRAAARRNSDAFTQATTSAIALLCGAGLVMVAGAAIVAVTADLRPLLGVEGLPVAADAAMLCYVAVFAVGLPLSLGPRLLIVLGRSRTLAVVSLAAVAAQVTAALLAFRAGVGLVGFSAIAAASATTIGAASLAAAIVAHPPALPRLRAATRGMLRALGRRSTAFVLIGAAAAIGFETDAAFVAALVGPAEAATYTVTMRLFLLVPTFLSVATLPLWPAVASRAAAGDPHIRSLFGRSVAAAFAVAAISGAGGVVLVDDLIMALFHGVSAPSVSVRLAIAAVAVVHSVSAPVAAFLGGLDLIREQALSAVAMVVGNVALSIFLTTRIGAIGPAVGTVAAQMFLTLLPMGLLIRRRLDAFTVGEAPR